MSRGIFDNFANEPLYTEAEKDWYVVLDHSDCLWYDLIINPPEWFNTKRYISDYLKQLQATVESQFDKRFIYFLAARKKLRFSTKKKPRYFWNRLVLYIEVGRERKLRKIRVTLRDGSGRLIKPPVEITDRFISLKTTEGKIPIPIHNFLRIYGVNLGINTEVHYVGYTKNPSERPLNRAHRGLADTLYKVSNEEYDFFVCYNLFKVLSIASNPRAAVNFYLANSMIDEVKVDEEGRIIEKALIRYFQTEPQELNKQSEKAELENSLIKLATKYKINSIVVHIEFEPLDEYYRFCSRAVAPSYKHIFTCRISDNSVEITQGSKLLDSTPPFWSTD